MASAVAGRERLRFAYRAGDGTESQRLVEPYRLVSTGRRWYLVAYDLDREDWRTFRVDRVERALRHGRPVRAARAADGERGGVCGRSMSRQQETYEFDVTFAAPAEFVAARLPPLVRRARSRRRAQLPAAGRRRRTRVEWLALRLALVDCEFTVHEPPELVGYVRELGARLTGDRRLRGVRRGGDPA